MLLEIEEIQQPNQVLHIHRSQSSAHGQVNRLTNEEDHFVVRVVLVEQLQDLDLIQTLCTPHSTARQCKHTGSGFNCSSEHTKHTDLVEEVLFVEYDLDADLALRLRVQALHRATEGRRTDVPGDHVPASHTTSITVNTFRTCAAKK